MKERRIIILLGIILAVIFVALASSGKISLSPRVSTASTSTCQLGPLTDCINGCWQKYNEKIEDIENAKQAHAEGCCGAVESCHWQKATEFYPGVCVQNSPPDAGSCQDSRYLDCENEFNTMPLIIKAEDGRRQCIKDCQNNFCSTKITALPSSN